MSIRLTGKGTADRRWWTRVVATVLFAAMLTACGGDDEAAQTGTPPPPPPPGGGNSPPTITGNPPTSVQQGQLYQFTPSAADPDNNTLTFSVLNAPSWAALNTTTGRLSGTPPSTGTFSNIQIRVSDGTATVSLAAFSIQVTAPPTGGATLTWVPPTTNTDGSAVSLSSLSYKIYWGSSSGNYSRSANVVAGTTSYLVEPLTAGTWFFVVTAINNQGVESSYSNVASKTL